MSRQTDLVTIGMPAYNCQEYLRQALDTLLSQTYSHFELLISDDASTDKTAEICRSYAKKDPRIRYIRQNQNIGFLKNFNYVLKKAQGKYFMWAGCDDFWDTAYIEKLYSGLKNNPHSVLAVSKFNNVYKSKRYDYLGNQEKASNLSQLGSLVFFMKSRNLSYYYGLHRTANLKKVGGYHKDSRPFFHSSDYLTIFKVLLKGPLTYVNETLFFKRDSGLFTMRYKTLRNLTINKLILFKIIRFLLFPVYYLYDLWFSVLYTLDSRLAPADKTTVIFYSLAFFFRNIFKFILEILTGIISIVTGIVMKLCL